MNELSRAIRIYDVVLLIDGNDGRLIVNNVRRFCIDFIICDSDTPPHTINSNSATMIKPNT